MKIVADKQRLEALGVWGKSYSYSRAIEADSGEYKHLHYGDIHGKLAGHVSSSQLPALTVKGKYEVISTGDVIFADASEDYDALGKASVVRVENGDKVLSGLHTHRFIVNKSLLDSGYLLSFTQSPVYKSFIRVIGNGVSVLGISKTNLGKLNIPLPSLAEQQKIAEFFSALDERIALTADKVKLLKEQKAGYLQQVFSRELVFTDDNGDTYGDWEQKKLGKMVSIATGKKDANAMVENGQYKFFTCSRETYNIDSYTWDCEAILMAGNGNIGEPKYYTGKFDAYQRTYILHNFEGILPLYLMPVIDAIFPKVVARETQTGSMPYIRLGTLTELLVPLPSLLEQQKIAEFFSALDEQLELTENKLALLKEQKKGYLQGIFG